MNIHNNETLLKACDVLHDGRLDLSEIFYNKEDGIWKAPFEREFLEDPSKIVYTKKYLLFTKVTFPMIQSVFCLEGIKTYQIEDKSRIGNFTFNECRIKEDMYRFVFCENMVIHITFNEKPSGSLKDLCFSNRKRSVLTFGNPSKTNTS